MKTLNKEALDALLELDLDTGGSLINDMIASFRSELPKRLPRLSEHFAKQDGKALSFDAHAIKSSFANFGALSIATVFQRIEAGSKANAWKDVETALAELPSAIAQFETDLLHLETIVNDPKRKEQAS